MTIFLFHDICQCHGRFESLVKWFQENNSDISFVAMDFVGHGLSSGTRGHFDEFSVLAKDIYFLLENEVKLENQKWFLLAHGLGGLSILELLNVYAGHFEKKIDGIILSNFIFYFHEHPILKLINNSFSNIGERFRAPKIFYGNDLTSDKSEAVLFEQDSLIIQRPTRGVLKRMTAQSLSVYREAYFLDWPILLLQSGNDKFLLTKGMEYFLMGLKKNLLTEKNYSNLKHDLYNEKDKTLVFNDILEWIKA